MNTCEPSQPLQPFIMNACCLTAAIGAYAALTLSIVAEGPGNYAVFQTNEPVQLMVTVENSEQTVDRPKPDVSEEKTTMDKVEAAPQKASGSQYTKSNQFMLKDAMCNFTNGELVCHRATGLRHLSLLSGS